MSFVDLDNESNFTVLTQPAVDSAKAPVTGSTWTIYLRRESDNYWWAGSAWQVSETGLAMTEITGTTSLDGVYEYDFTAQPSDESVDVIMTTNDANVVNNRQTMTLRFREWSTTTVTNEALSTQLTSISSAITTLSTTTLSNLESNVVGEFDQQTLDDIKRLVQAVVRDVENIKGSIQ